MKLTIIVSSTQYLRSAGNRIRYQRLVEPLAQLGCTLSIAVIDALDVKNAPTAQDIFLFSKVQDARGIALAHTLRAGGARVGVDLFDDYFSQVDDARFAPQRVWLARMAQTSDFFLCSTERMKQVAEHSFGPIVGHVLNDPFERFDRDRLAPRMEAKLRKAMEARCISLLWFGMGDNPNFPVGLHDLAHQGRIIEDFLNLGFEVKLTVLTNERALDSSGLALLRRLPVRPNIELWTQPREQALLEESLLSFLPVNAQGFSIAKSLNRAVTALASGTQLLSVGYPLYAPLDAFLYRDAASFIDDLSTGTLRVSGATLGALGDQLDRLSNPITEAESLLSFLQAIASSPSSTVDGSRLAIVHGERSTGAIHKFAQQRQWLSFASPYASPGLSYDAHLAAFEPGGAPSLRMSARVASTLRGHFAKRAKSISDRNKAVLELRPADFGQDIFVLLANATPEARTGTKIALYPKVIDATRRVYTELFGPLVFIDSELNPALCSSQELHSHSGQAAG